MGRKHQSYLITFFMDDCSLFMKDKPDSVETLLNVLQQYEQASGTED